MHDRNHVSAVIFDCDGVILLSEPHHMAAWVKLAKEVMCPLPVGFLEKGLGCSDEELAMVLATAWREDGVDYAWILRKKRFYYQSSLASTMTLVPGVLAAIQHFHAKVPLALATSSSIEDIRPVIEKYDLNSYFSVILTVEDVGRPKPDPEVYLKTAQALGVPAASCLVFEDSHYGIIAAQRAGMNVIALTTGFKEHELPQVSGYIPDFLALDSICSMVNNVSPA